MTIANLKDQELAIEIKGKGFPEVCCLFVFVQKKIMSTCSALVFFLFPLRDIVMKKKKKKVKSSKHKG